VTLTPACHSHPTHASPICMHSSAVALMLDSGHPLALHSYPAEYALGCELDMHRPHADAAAG